MSNKRRLQKLRNIVPSGLAEHFIIQSLGHRLIGGPGSESWQLTMFDRAARAVGYEWAASGTWYRLLERIS